MPRLKGISIKRLRVLAGAGLGMAVLCCAAPAISAAACPAGALSQPFARFGDSASYMLLTGGSFESAHRAGRCTAPR